jgi:hypothetical protein
MTNYKGNSLQLVDNSKSKSKNRKVQPSNHLPSTPRNSESQPDSTLDKSKTHPNPKLVGPLMIFYASGLRPVGLLMSRENEEELRKANPSSNLLTEAESDAVRQALLVFNDHRLIEYL